LLMLKQEFARRNLSMDIFDPIENEQTEWKEREPMPGFYNPATHADDMILGRYYTSFKDPALENGSEENKTNFTSSMTQDDLKNLIKKCTCSMIINGIIFLIGIADTIIAFLMVSEKGGSFFIAWGVIAFGGFKFFYAFAERTEYQNTLKNIFFEFEEGEVKNDS